ncbi:hypothetical protein SARC_10092 [Sphaeroforma arctica JP610]|uniref:Uncharacterized protein n=1 Tax=Sphaeroforma arctica JP610 TaxID=667725 RepID=A0A0L0FN41_9EUKA|nr:hypothetical protein SARC_10092 [Sphaeroforma arctica JP610]KNC77448.1 hypothetical protein SARC_10092 [Sphaeroforma arctica JP610]|eukprot:XP_014151350.1 hypothetical protein SARC_10092 [Sphaeroforma arctica JP610]
MILAQLDGFTKGFNRKAALSDGAIPAMTEVEILWLNSIGDVLDLHVADKNIDETSTR